MLAYGVLFLLRYLLELRAVVSRDADVFKENHAYSSLAQ